tara:strand:+ start:332 stop:1042 length:711 start_codon:yes stop_codon:yes gene_type:complete
MSRYIDLDLYHAVEKTHPFYVEMTALIIQKISNFCMKQGSRKILELGAGTGLFSKELLKLDGLELDILEYDIECCRILEQNVDQKKCQIIHGDAVTYRNTKYYDIIVSVFAHDHICYEKGKLFSGNIAENLTEGGLYIMGGELLPEFSNNEERREALYKYHLYIINKALKENNFEVAQIEINALKSGLEMIGDFKRHEKMFEEEMGSGGLKLIGKSKVGPSETNDVGGVFVYIFEA